MTRWRLLREPRGPGFKCVVGFGVSCPPHATYVTVCLLFWSLTFVRDEENAYVDFRGGVSGHDDALRRR